MKKAQFPVLVADDDSSIRRLLKYSLEKIGMSVVVATDGTEAMALMDDSILSVLLDLKMPGASGTECLTFIKEKYPEIPVIMISGVGQVSEAVAAMKQGAFEYVTKPFELDELLCLVQRTVRIARDFREAAQLKQSWVSSKPRLGFGGESESTQQLLQQVGKIAGLNSTVLVTGESGTGKSLLARVIHYAGSRAKGPFISVSCPSLPRELLESEMFGHEKGAFTAAVQRRLGRIEMAQGGTLFLDEIGDLPLHLQPKLLTFLQERQYQRVGGTEVMDADVRVIAATNVDLEERVRGREFREDLYFRLNVIPLKIPPLRERRGDIAPLAGTILDQIAQARGCAPFQFEPEAKEALLRYGWPGNVRELENVLERASAFCDAGIIRAKDLPLQKEVSLRKNGTAGTPSDELNFGGMRLVDIERLAIQKTLALCEGNKAEAARRLGVTEKTIYNKLARYELRESSGK